MNKEQFYQEREKIRKAVDAFALKMKQRLFEKIDEGFSGWDDQNDVNLGDIAYRMTSKAAVINSAYFGKDAVLDRNRFLDIANFSMMLDYHNSENDN
jgi:hypothetical protein